METLTHAGHAMYFSNRMNRNFSPLSLLAEVASEKLSSEPHLWHLIGKQSSSSSEEQSDVTTDSDTPPPTPMKAMRANPTLSLNQVAKLSSLQLIKHFSVSVDEEVKRKYHYSCQFLPSSCFFKASSFGSETAARNDIKKHLKDHVNALFSLYPSWSRREEVMLNPVQPKAKAETTIKKREKKTKQIFNGSIMTSSSEENDALTVNKDAEARKVYKNNKKPSHENIPSNARNNIIDLPMNDDNNNSQNSAIANASQIPQFVNNSHIQPDTIEFTGLISSGVNPVLIEETVSPENPSTNVVKATAPKNPKKPKGRAKFIGQSDAEKEMALQLIQQMRSGGGGSLPQDALECRICSPPRPFTAPSTLLSHYRSHAGICPFVCNICSAVFTRQHSLNYHLLIHANQTRFTCDDCGRKFRHPSHFKEHRRRHTGESPYECYDCIAKFKTRNTYKRHLRTRHNKVLTTQGGVMEVKNAEAQVRYGDREEGFRPSILRAALSTKHPGYIPEDAASASDREYKAESSSDSISVGSDFNIKDENNGNTDHSQQWSKPVFNNVVVSDVKFIESADVNLFSMLDDKSSVSIGGDSQLTTIILEPAVQNDRLSYATKENFPISVGRNEEVASEKTFPPNCQVITIPKSVVSAKSSSLTKNVITKVHLPSKVSHRVIRNHVTKPEVHPYKLVRKEGTVASNRPLNSVSVVNGHSKRQVLKLSTGPRIVPPSSML